MKIYKKNLKEQTQKFIKENEINGKISDPELNFTNGYLLGNSEGYLSAKNDLMEKLEFNNVPKSEDIKNNSIHCSFTAGYLIGYYRRYTETFQQKKLNVKKF